MNKPLPLASEGVFQFSVPDAEVHLMPGEWFFGQNATVKTLLGSCVAMTLWHPRLHAGGMCHYLLPTRRPDAARPFTSPLSGRYGDEVIELLVKALQRCGTHAGDYVVQLFGGADLLHEPMPRTPAWPLSASAKFNVGKLNVEQAWTQVRRFGFDVNRVDVGEHVARRVSIDLSTGDVEVQRGAARAHASRAA